MTPDRSETDSASSREFAPGDRVWPESRSDLSPARVVEYRDETAGTYEIDAIGQTVTEYADVPDDDPVVAIVYESDLDRYVPKWRTWSCSLTTAVVANLREFEREWNVTVRRYTFGESALRDSPPDEVDT